LFLYLLRLSINKNNNIIGGETMTWLNTFLFLAFFCFTTSHLFSQDFDFFEPKATIGGYGELHYNYEKPEVGESRKLLDFHRFVVFFGYAWTEKWSFKSEVELEHNFVRNGQGELELEQAYVNYHHSDYFGFQVGVILPSAGLINEYHEPPLFFGVERPEYNNRIIPTTWFGNGVAVYGAFEGFDYKVVVMEGLDADGFSASSGIRGGRQKGFNANAENLLYNFRLDYLGVPGLKFGASFTTNKAMGDSIDNQIGLAEFHAMYNANNIYALFEFGNISYDNGNTETSRGFYLDFGYNIGSLFKCDSKIIPFFRYSDVNTAAKTVSGGDSEKANHYKYLIAGINFHPIDKVVFKFDYGVRTRELGDVKTTLINLGAGYMF
jgi:hypothetical protein